MPQYSSCRMPVFDLEQCFSIVDEGHAELTLWKARSVRRRDTDKRMTERHNGPNSPIAHSDAQDGHWRASQTKEVSVFNRVLQILPAVCLATSMAWATESPFIGEWKLDPSKTRMPDEMKVQSQGANKYAFDFGGGTETILVDGSDQTGCCGTQLSVKPEAADTWIVERKKDGRLLLRATWKLSKDQNTLTDYYREFESNGETHSMDYGYQRTGSGGSGFAADWQSIKETMNSPYSIEVKAFDGDGLSFINPSDHQTTSAKFDGKDYPNQGPGAERGVTSSMRQVDERTLMMTNKADGKVIETDQIGLSADRKTLTITKHIPGHDKPIVMVFKRK